MKGGNKKTDPNVRGGVLWEKRKVFMRIRKLKDGAVRKMYRPDFQYTIGGEKQKDQVVSKVDPGVQYRRERTIFQFLGKKKK